MAHKKKRKYKLKKTFKLFIYLIVFLILIINIKRITNFAKCIITGYKYETIEVFNELDIYGDVWKHKYSKTLEVASNSEEFKKEYVDDYLDIKYNKNDKDFITNINALLLLGYDSHDINKIYDILSLDSIKVLENNEYYNGLFKMLWLDYFHEEYLERYLEYANKNELEYQDVVTYVNAGLDNEYYTNMIKIDKQDDILVLVNKYHYLSSDYVPSDLEEITNKYNVGNNNKLRHVARIAFEKMCEEALKDNIKIYSGSAYRSYSHQNNLYNTYVSENGKKKADTFSARPGSSEHQTGLATDIVNAQFEFISASDKEYTWLVNNAYKYGFILRYPEGKEKVTGYMFEEWHFRYVGEKIAKTLYDMNITYDEYMARN